MGRYWLRIALGALAIFCTGMVVIRFAKPKIEQVRTAVARLPASFEDPIPFKFEGEELGRIEVLRVSTDSGTGTPDVSLSVALDSSHSFKVPDCDFTVLDVEGAHISPGFRCAPKPLPSAEWTRVGELTFLPSGVVRPLILPTAKGQRMARRLSSIQIESHAGKTDIIVDSDGHPVLRFSADSNGATMHVRDSQGREIVRMKADSTGFALEVKDTAKH